MKRFPSYLRFREEVEDSTPPPGLDRVKRLLGKGSKNFILVNFPQMGGGRNVLIEALGVKGTPKFFGNCSISSVTDCILKWPLSI